MYPRSLLPSRLPNLRDLSGYFSQAMYVLANQAACHNPEICVFYEINIPFRICPDNCQQAFESGGKFRAEICWRTRRTVLD
jgi:hypothetical protein